MARSLGGVAFAVALLAAVSAAAETVDVELVLLVDVSSSVTEEEYALQKSGHAEAFRNPALHRAIASGWYGRIAVTYVEWDTAQTQVVGWRRIASPAEADAFADALMAAPRHAGPPTTSIAGALRFAPSLFADNGFEGLRRIIDISGDGADNTGGATPVARDQALSEGVTAINGIVIPNEVGVEEFYQANVVGGGGAFLMVAKDFSAFREAILDKLVREVAALPSPRRIAHAAE